MQRVIEVISSIPNLVIVTMLGLLLGNGVMSIIISIAIVGWTSMARQVRNLTLSYREREFVLASRALGENKFKIAFKHVLPNISGIIIVQIMMTVPSAIMYEAVLSAINLGVKPPTASLGSLITDASENLQYYPYQVVIPALALVFISLAFILLGEACVMHLTLNLTKKTNRSVIMTKETILSVKNLHVNFHTYAGEVKAIRDVNFDLKKGEH